MYTQIRQLWYLCLKEIWLVLKDPANRIVLIVPPILQGLLFGYAATFNLTTVNYALWDESHSKESTALLAQFDGSGRFKRVALVNSPQEMQSVIDREQAMLVLHIGSSFSSDLKQGKSADIQLIVDGRNSTTAGSALSYVNAIIARYNAQQGFVLPVQVIDRVLYNPNLESRWSIMVGLIASLSMIQTLMLAALSVAREREQGTFDQLLVTPYTPMQIMIGKALPSVCIGVIQSLLIMALTLYWFDVPFSGNGVLFFLTLIAFNIAVVGVGLSISALTNSMQQAMLYSFVTIMPMTLLSGLASPIKNMPLFFQIVTYANPLRFAIDLVRRIYLEAGGLSEVWHDFVPLICITLVTWPLAAYLFKNRLA